MAQDDFLQFQERVKQAESRGRRYDKNGNLLTSPKGAQGEMQVMPATQRSPGFGITPAKDRSPEEIARVGTDYLATMKKRYGDETLAAIAYNMGPGATDKWLAAGADFSKLPAETQGYVQKVMGKTPSAPATASAPASQPTPSEQIVEPALRSGMTASAEDLGSGYKAALALSFLGADEADKPESDDDLQARLDKEEEDTAAAELAAYKPKNAFADLKLSATSHLQPVHRANGSPITGEDPQQEAIDEMLSEQPRSFLSRASEAVQSAARQGLDAMFPIRRIVRTGVEPTAKEAMQKFEQAVKDDPQAYLKNKDFGEDLASRAHFHIKNAGRRAMGLEPFEDKSRVYLGPITEDSFPNPNNPIPPELRTSTGLPVLRRNRFADGGDVVSSSMPLNPNPMAGTPEMMLWHGGVVHRADGSPIGGEKLEPLEQRFTDTGYANTKPPTRSAQQLQAYLEALNPSVQVNQRRLEPGLFGYVEPEQILEHPGQPNVLNINTKLSPGTAETTTLHELEHTMDLRGGDILGRPKVRYSDNNYRAYYLMDRDWRPINQTVKNIVNNKEKIEQFFGRPIESGYFSPKSLDNLMAAGDEQSLFKEQIATLAALEQATGKSLTQDPEMRNIFPSTKMMAVYDALTGPRQTRLDARDLPPHTPQPSYMYETNPVMRFLKEKLGSKNEYGVPVRRADGSPEEGEMGPYIGNPNIQRQGQKARELAAQRDVNTLPDPRTYAAVSGFLGTPPDQQGFSVLHPDLEGIKKAGDVGFMAGTAAQIAPAVGAMRNLGKGVTDSAKALQGLKDIPVGASTKPVEPFFRHMPTPDAPFVGRLDEFVAGMQNPVRKDQFLGQLNGKFRDYEIERAQRALADLPENAKLQPVDLLNRLKERYDPSTLRTTILEPETDRYWANQDNPYKGQPVGVVHLSTHASPEQMARINKLDKLDLTLWRLGRVEENSQAAIPGTEVFRSDPIASTQLDRIIAARQDLIDRTGPIREAKELMNDIRYPAISPRYNQLYGQFSNEIRQAGGYPDFTTLNERVKSVLIPQAEARLTQLFGEVPLSERALKEAMTKKFGENWMTEISKAEKNVEDMSRDFRRYVSGNPQIFGIEVPYKGKGIHSALNPPPNAASFTRFVEQQVQDPVHGQMKGIHLLEIQSDLTSELKAGRDVGLKKHEVFPNMAENRRVVQQLGMKNAIAAAIQRGDQFVTFPGKESAKPQLYESVRDNLKQVAKDLGPGFEVRPFTFKNAEGTEMQHWGITWSPKAAVRTEIKGVPFKDGGSVERKTDDNRRYL